MELMKKDRNGSTVLLIFSISCLILCLSGEASRVRPPKSSISLAPSGGYEPEAAPPVGADLAFLLNWYIKKARATAESAVDFASSRMKGANSTEYQCLASCEDRYRAIVGNFNQAKDCVREDNLYLLNQKLSQIFGHIANCKACLKDAIPGDSPMEIFEKAISGAVHRSLSLLQITT